MAYHKEWAIIRTLGNVRKTEKAKEKKELDKAKYKFSFKRRK